MASIDIQHPHTLAPPRARQAVQDILDFTRSGIDGRIALLPGQVHVTAQLGFLLGAMKGPIEAEIRRVLDERF